MTTAPQTITERLGRAMLLRNRQFEDFFLVEAERLAIACRKMAERFRRGGRLLAFGRGACATDAQHVSVEFVHPVIVGKRALPALDISCAFQAWLPAILQTNDIVMGFGPPHGDVEVDRALDAAWERGAMTFALPGSAGDYSLRAPDLDPFVHQEMIEFLYHTLWETVHVFLEHQQVGPLEQGPGETGFLYPFLNHRKPNDSLVSDVAKSIVMKAADDARLRAAVACDQANAIAGAVRAMDGRLSRGGKLILFGNGGSATDANDWALDCVLAPPGRRPIPAISLSLEPASITALANDVGPEVIFSRQLMAQARPEDVAIAISTSGGSRNIVMALEEARKRGLLTVALLGCDGGEIVRRNLADYPLVVRCDYIPRIQEVQASIYHVICELLQEGVAHA